MTSCGIMCVFGRRAGREQASRGRQPPANSAPGADAPGSPGLRTALAGLVLLSVERDDRLHRPAPVLQPPLALVSRQARLEAAGARREAAQRLEVGPDA